MLLGIPAQAVIDEMGNGRTRPRELSQYITSKWLYRVSERLTRVNKNTVMPDYAILHVLWPQVGPRRRAHWVLRWQGRVLDPLTVDSTWHLTSGGKVSSYLSVEW